VTQVNTSLTEKPEAVNTDPHNAWMIAVKVADPGETAELYDSAKYAELTK
jgi:glycine cleavage system H lipoate-binding protein